MLLALNLDCVITDNGCHIDSFPVDCPEAEQVMSNQTVSIEKSMKTMRVTIEITHDQ